MKKTLVALAVLAASGASFAQSSATLSGKFGFAYQDSKSAAGVTTNGFATTDGDVVFAAVEDLGAGMKAGASMALRLRGRGTQASVVDGRDASVYVSGGFGKLTAGSVEEGAYLVGRAAAGAPTIGLDDGVVVVGAKNIDMVSYTSPAFVAGLTATVTLMDSYSAPAAGGLQDIAPTTDGNLIGLTYDAGALSAGIDYTKFGQNAAAVTEAESRTRLSASYDLGVAKLGAGYETTTSFSNVKNTGYLLGVSAPLGAFTLGATYAMRDNDANALDAKGWELGANYALSKRTNVQVAYKSTKVDSAADAATSTRIRLMHSF